MGLSGVIRFHGVEQDAPPVARPARASAVADARIRLVGDKRGPAGGDVEQEEPGDVLGGRRGPSGMPLQELGEAGGLAARLWRPNF